MKKITYKDKKKEYVKIDSPFVILADDANEMKRVINSLVVNAEEVLTFSQAARFIGVIIPESLFKDEKFANSSWSVKLVLSSSPDFSGKLLVLDSNSLDSEFFQFSDGLQKFMKFTRASIGDTGSLVYADLRKYDLTGKYFAKFTFCLNPSSSKNFDGIAIGAIGYEDVEEYSEKYSKAEGEIRPGYFALTAEEIQGRELAWRLYAEYPERTSRTALDSSFTVELADASCNAGFSVEREGNEVRIAKSSLSSDRLMTVMLKAIDSYGAAASILLKFDPEVDELLGKRLDLASAISAFKDSNWSLKNVWSRSQETSSVELPFSEDIIFSRNAVKASKAFEEGKAAIVRLPDSTENLVQIKPESFSSFKLVDIDTNTELEELWSLNTYNVKIIGVTSDNEEVEIPPEDLEISLEGLSQQFAETDGERTIAVKDVRDKLVSLVNVKISYAGQEKKLSKPVVVVGSALSRLIVLGPSEINGEGRSLYSFSAKKTDGSSLQVMPQQVILSSSVREEDAFTWSVDTSSSKVILDTHDSLWDYQIKISGAYVDVSFEDEKAEGFLDVVVKGGFSSSFTGQLVISDGEDARTLSFSEELEVPSARKEDAVSSKIENTISSDIGLQFSEQYPIALKILANEKPMELKEAVAVFKTSSGAEFEKDFVLYQNGLWLLEDGVPELAVELKALRFRAEFNLTDYFLK